MVEKHKDSNLKIYVVWLPIMPTDARDKWKKELIQGDQVTHLWDGTRRIGKWFADNVTSCDKLAAVAWDAYYLFDKDTKWEDVPSSVRSCGTPVIAASDQLAKDLEAMLAGEGSDTKP